MSRLAVPLALSLLLAACVESTGAEQRVLGIIGIHRDRIAPEVLQLPDSVAAGKPFTATVVTYRGSCARPDRTELILLTTQAHILPWDREPAAGMCTDDLQPVTREVELRFDVAGTAVVRVQGRTLYGGIEVLGRPLRVY